MARFTDPDEARKYLSGLSEHKNRPGDTSSLNPAFAVRMANAISDARAAGIPATFMSGYREGNVTGSKYDMSGKSSHSYGLATDIGGIGGAGSKTAQQWAQIAQANGLHNPYGVNNKAEFNHWQLPELPLEQMPDQLARLRAAKASGDINQVWATAAPFTGGTQIASAGAAPIGALAKPASPYGNPFLDSLATIESNNQNIFSGVDKDYPGQPGSRSQGYFQIDTPTWQQFAAKAGIDTVKYPSAMNAPPEVQAQVAQLIPFSRFGQRTQDMLTKQYGAFDKKATVGELAGKFGGGAAPATAVASTAPATAADQPWWSKYTEAPTDKEGKPVEGAKSPVEKAINAFTGSSNKARMESQMQAGDGGFGQGPGARNVSPGLQNIAQTYGQTLNSFMQPLTWSAGPPQVAGMAPAGFQGSVPGLSLNSVQAPPEGLGYGIASNYGLG